MTANTHSMPIPLPAYVPEPSRIRYNSYRLDGLTTATVTGRFTHPSIVIVDNVLTDSECRSLIEPRPY
jgi:hypothetical protein